MLPWRSRELPRSIELPWREQPPSMPLVAAFLSGIGVGVIVTLSVTSMRERDQMQRLSALVDELSRRIGDPARRAEELVARVRTRLAADGAEDAADETGEAPPPARRPQAAAVVEGG